MATISTQELVDWDEDEINTFCELYAKTDISIPHSAFVYKLLHLLPRKTAEDAWVFLQYFEMINGRPTVSCWNEFREKVKSGNIKVCSDLNYFRAWETTKLFGPPVIYHFVDIQNEYASLSCLSQQQLSFGQQPDVKKIKLLQYLLEICKKFQLEQFTLFPRNDGTFYIKEIDTIIRLHNQ